jgi:hypothetical protein
MNKYILKLIAGSLLFIAQQTTADVYGIVIGIDAYKNVNGLDGAVNDAKMVADSLNDIGAKQVRLLIDDKATRDEIKNAWNEISTQAKAGDTVFFTYAGHGAQQPERVKGTEVDGQDEFYVLTNFAESGPSTYERLIDDDLQEWFSKRPDLTIVLVSDSCHSGTMTRAYKKSKLKYRKVPVNAITNDALPVSNNPDIVNEQKTKMPHVISFAGVSDNEEVPEINIENQPHGALSWNFSKGLLGLADANKDGTVSVSELKNYLIEKVSMTTEGQQHPQISFVNDIALVQKYKNNVPNKASVVTFSVNNNQANPPLVQSVLDNLKGVQLVNNERGTLEWDVGAGIIKDRTDNPVYSFPVRAATKAYKRKDQPTDDENPQDFVKAIQPVIDGFLANQIDNSQISLADDLQPISFSISQNLNNEVFAKSVVEKLSGIQLVEPEKSFLEWDIDGGVIRNQFNDVVYNFSAVENQTRAFRRKEQGEASISPEIIERLRAVINKFRLIEKLKLLSDGSLGIKLLPSDKLHVKGETVTFEVNRLKYPYFTLINLAVDGTVNFLYPSQPTDTVNVPEDKPYKLELEVSEPFGADQFVAIVSDKPLSSLHEILKKLNNSSSSLEELRKALLTELKETKYQIGVHASFTASSL